jgi:Flp pilus assembly protein TadD
MVICVVLALGTLLLYAPVLTFDFINWDDPDYVTKNFHLYGGLSWRGLAWCFQLGYGGNWIPLVWLSYMLDYQFHALNPAGYHATNVVLHTANTVLLFLVLKQMTGAVWRSAMVGALFAWHPMHVESVAWVAERKDVLSTLFWLLTICAYLSYARKGGGGRYFLVLLLFAFGLMAKPMLVTLPFVLLLLDWWPLRRFPSKTPKIWRLILEKIPMFLLAAGCSALTALLQNREGAVASLAELPLQARLLNAVVSYWRYIEKIIWPLHLSVIYPFRDERGDIVTAILMLAVISVATVCFRKRFPYLMLGWLWYLGTLVPVIGLVQVGAQGMADRYTYIPSIGLFMMFCWGAFDLAQSGVDMFDNQIVPRRAQWLPGSLCLATLVMCGWATSNQLQYWKDSGTLFSHAVALDPKNYMARKCYGLFLCEQGKLPEAILQLRKAVQIFPKGPDAHTCLGQALCRAGDDEAAAAELGVALRLRPNDAAEHEEMGSILIDQKLPGEAAAEFGVALQYKPDNPTTHYLLGVALGMQGRMDEAREQFAEALRLNPQFAEAHYQLALALSMQHKTTEAITQYRMAIRLQSALPEALNNLAWILATDPHAEIRNGTEAVQLARRACVLTRNAVPIMIGTLAAACAEAGQFDEAIADAQMAHDLAVAQGSNKVAAKNVELLMLFRSHHAYHE